MKVKPIYQFTNAQEAIKSGQIKAVTTGKCGIYSWYNNVNGKTYVGSAVDLWNRICDYNQEAYQREHANDPIVRALVKYGLANFTLYVLEYTSSVKEVLLAAEQKYLDLLQPEYNVLKTAGNSQGYKHSEEARARISEQMLGRPRSQAVRDAMSLRQQGEGNTFYGKQHTDEAKQRLRELALARTSDPNPGYQVTLTNVDNPTDTREFKSLRKAAAFLTTTHGKVRTYV
jgi:group I intron endonuclease